MKKKLNIVLCMFLLMLSVLMGCQSDTGQAVSDGEIQSNNNGTSEIQTEREYQSEVGTETESQIALETEREPEKIEQEVSLVEEDGSYTSKEEVAAYLNQYGRLPSNFITKKEAKKLGWVSKEGNLGEVAPGKSIGGDYFGNYEGILPEEDDRDYYECDINSDGGYRGAERIVYSNDGLIYYTGDHYETFELLYGE